MTRITDERLAELESTYRQHAMTLSVQSAEDTAAALRELQQLRCQHREIICRECYLRDQIGSPEQVDKFDEF